MAAATSTAPIFWVQGNSGKWYQATYLQDSSGSFIKDPRYGIAELNSTTGQPIQNSNLVLHSDASLNGANQVYNTDGNLVVPLSWASGNGFQNLVNQAASLPGSGIGDLGALTTYKTGVVLPGDPSTVNVFTLIGPGNPQKYTYDPVTGVGSFDQNEFVQAFTHAASYLLGSVVAVRGDLSLIQTAGVFNGLQGGGNNSGWWNNPAANSVEFVAGIQSIQNNSFNGLVASGKVPTSSTNLADTAAVASYFSSWLVAKINADIKSGAFEQLQRESYPGVDNSTQSSNYSFAYNVPPGSDSLTTPAYGTMSYFSGMAVLTQYNGVGQLVAGYAYAANADGSGSVSNFALSSFGSPYLAKETGYAANGANLYTKQLNSDGTYNLVIPDVTALTYTNDTTKPAVAAVLAQIAVDQLEPGTGISFTGTMDAAGNILASTVTAVDKSGTLPITREVIQTVGKEVTLADDQMIDGIDVQTRNTKDAQGNSQTSVSVGQWKTTTTVAPPPIITGSAVGQIFGSSIGNALAGAIAGPNQFAQLAVGTGLSALLGTVGSTAGSLFDAVGNSSTFAADVTTAFNSFAPNLGAAFVSQSIGSVSSFLAGELASSLGIGGTFGGKIGTIVASSLINNAITNVANGVSVFTGLSGDIFKLPSLSPSGALIPGGIGFNIGSNIGSFLGSALANDNVPLKKTVA